MSDTLRHFIRESLLSEIEQTTWMKGGYDQEFIRADAKGIGSKVYEFTKNLFNKGVSFLGFNGLFSGRRKKTAWGKKVGAGAVLTAGGAALFSWLKSGKTASDTGNDAQKAVEDAEQSMLDIESKLGELFARNSSILTKGVTLNVNDATVASKPMTERIESFKDHFEKILSNAGGITLQRSFTSESIGSASQEYETIFLKISQFRPLESEIDNIVGDGAAEKAWATRLIVARHAMDVELAIGSASDALTSAAKDAAEQQQVKTASDELVGQFSNIDAFKVAFDAVKD
jgi:hypothetical protein